MIKTHLATLSEFLDFQNKIFHFKEVKIGEIEKEILKLDKTKASQKTDITTRIIKENIDIEFLCTSTNSPIKSTNFPSSLKLADVTPLHKKERKDMKENFRPVSILSTLSKTFEKCMFAQKSTFSDKIFRTNNAVFEKDIILSITFW